VLVVGLGYIGQEATYQNRDIKSTVVVAATIATITVTPPFDGSGRYDTSKPIIVDTHLSARQVR